MYIVSYARKGNSIKILLYSMYLIQVKMSRNAIPTTFRHYASQQYPHLKALGAQQNQKRSR